MSEQQWETVQEESPDNLTFDTPGEDVFTGYYLGSEVIENEGDEFTRYLFRQLSDNRYIAINASYRLTQAMEKVEAGALVRIEYVKNIDTGMPSPMKDFRVSVAK